MSLKLFTLFLLTSLFFQRCQIKEPIEPNVSIGILEEMIEENIEQPHINTNGAVIKERFFAPKGFKRFKAIKGSFQEFLQQLPLKKIGSKVKYYNGRIKPNNYIYDAVIDLPIGSKNLHQCADAIIRLRAKYLWEKNRYDEIHFDLSNGFRVDYNKWKDGNRIHVDGNTTTWVKKYQPSNTKQDLWEYLETVFMYAGTLSLDKELKDKSIHDIQIGDIFIQGGSPGHAVIVVDMALKKNNRDKVIMLAQSFMPAQETQILHNPTESKISPWYSINTNNKLQTPEWNFNLSDLKGF